jgi:hypothetical protein
MIRVFIVLISILVGLAEATLTGGSAGEVRKVSMDLDIRYEIRVDDINSSVADIEIFFITDYKEGVVEVDISTDDGLKIVEGGDSYRINLPPQESIKLKVLTVEPKEYYIKVVTKIDKYGFRAFTIPVNMNQRVIDRDEKVEKSISFNGTEKIKILHPTETISK